MQPGDLTLVSTCKALGSICSTHSKRASEQAVKYTNKTETRPQAVREMAKATAQPMTHITLSAH